MASRVEASPGSGIFVVGTSFRTGGERVKNERKCCDAEAEMKNARKRKTEMLPTAIRMLKSNNIHCEQLPK